MPRRSPAIALLEGRAAPAAAPEYKRDRRPRIDERAIAADYSTGLELPDSLHDGRRSQPDVAGNVRLCLASVGLQDFDDAEVESVDSSSKSHLDSILC